MKKLTDSEIERIILEIWPTFKPFLPGDDDIRTLKKAVDFVHQINRRSEVQTSTELTETLREDRKVFQDMFIEASKGLSQNDSYYGENLDRIRSQNKRDEFESLCMVRIIDHLLECIQSKTTDQNREFDGLFHGVPEIRIAFFDMISPRLDKSNQYIGVLTNLKALHETFKNENLISVTDQQFFEVVRKWLKIKQGISAFEKYPGTKNYLRLRTSYKNQIKERRLDSYLQT